MTTGDGLAIIGVCYLVVNTFQILHAWMTWKKRANPDVEERLQKVERTLDDNGLYL